MGVGMFYITSMSGEELFVSRQYMLMLITYLLHLSRISCRCLELLLVVFVYLT